MLRIILIMLMVQSTFAVEARAVTPEAAEAANDKEFKAKLSESLQKTDKSIKVIRKQVIESQNAPFLADLYVQLGDLLAQKAITLYYVKMENDAKVETGPTKIDEAQPVVAATREAIEVYKTVLHDFPNYPKRAELTYKLAVSYKSIDDIPQFIMTVSKVLKDFPNTEYSMRASLLLGRHFLDTQEYDEAFKVLTPITESKLIYEKNLAKYWIGLTYLGKEKYSEALSQFEAVIQDPELKEQENPYDIKKKSAQTKTDLKREALIDSIRAYTYVYAKNPDPVGYYSKISPTEVYFQEVLEKLAIRYVLLKKYDQSVRLLRTTSERIADPQKVINVYREVLLLMPLEQRLLVPVEEIRFVLNKFNLWQSYEKVPPKIRSDAYWFFEKQIRDVATRNHERGKIEKDPVKRKTYLELARDYYLLYLPFFNNTPNTVKLATDLADIYYLMGKYLESGDIYLKIFQGDYGKSPNRKALVENSILSLQKEKSEVFYEKVRDKGLLIKAISSYQASSKEAKNDPKLELLKLKTEYEQGFLPQALTNLFNFAKANRKTSQAIDAGDIIMDYFNTLNDFANLQLWSDRLLGLKLPNSEFNAKLVKIKAQAKNKIVQEKVKSFSGYDEFSQGKSYLTAALQSNDSDLKDAVIQEALAKSKREHDLDTFLQAAKLIAKKEKNPQKRSAIYKSVAQQDIKIGRIYTGIGEYRTARADSKLDGASRRSLYEDEINVSLMLHDLKQLNQSIKDPSFSQVSPQVKTRVKDQMTDALDSPIDLDADQVNTIFSFGFTDESMLAFYKSRMRRSPAIRSRVEADVRSHCSPQSRTPVCLWEQLTALEASRVGTIKALRTTPPDLKALEGVAGQFMEASRRYQGLEGGGDPHLETIVSIRGREIYAEFAAYLTRVANANAALKADLMAKANESLASAKVYGQKCATLAQKALAVNPAMKFCNTAAPTLDQMLNWQGGLSSTAPRSDTITGAYDKLQKTVFSTDTDPDPMMKLAAYYFQDRQYYHAAALASYGSSLYKSHEGEFETILGCAVLKIGFLNEAAFHLKSATDYQNMKAPCAAALQNLRLK